MNGLESFFQSPDALGHPKIPAWSALLGEAGNQASCQIEREREGFGYRRAKIYLHVDSPAHARTTDQDDWDGELNQFLLDRKVRAISPANEQLRYALMLKERLKRPEVRFGDGYFNAVLLELVTTAFRESAEVLERLAEIAPSNPSHGRAYAECVAMIETCIATCARSLVKDLGYERPVAEQVLAGAMGLYLDERFSLVSRRLLGLR